MARSSRQTFKKRQRELAKKLKKEDKANRLAARRGDGTITNGTEPDDYNNASSDGEKPTLKIYAVGSSSEANKR